MKKSSIYQRFIIWRLKKIGQKQFIILLSALIGLGVGIAAVILKNLVHFIQLLLTDKLAQPYHYLYFVFPVIGILLTILFIKYINREPVRHGIPNVLHSISKKSGMISRHNIYSSIIASSLTVGFGGSAGLEGPTVLTGAAIGSNIGKYFRMEYTQIILLIGCACSGAMAAIFKAPVAAIVFSLEVIMLDLILASLVPLLISSLTAALTSYLLLGQNILYPFTIIEMNQWKMLSGSSRSATGTILQSWIMVNIWVFYPGPEYFPLIGTCLKKYHGNKTIAYLRLI